MRYYLSSYKLGDRTQELLQMLPSGSRLAYIPNALDPYPDPDRKVRGNNADMDSLRELGYVVDLLDLQDYFGQPEKLRLELEKYDGVWIRGGNTFSLRQAMKLSGFDDLIVSFERTGKEFFYGGYSAGVCVLSPDLRGLDIVDDATVRPYGDMDTIWEGLGLIDYAVAPHYRSDHPESEMVEEEVKYYQERNIPCRTLRDGEVIIIE